MLGPNEIKYLKKGKNTLAAFGVVRFAKNKADDGYHHIGQMDLYLEGLNTDELGF